MEDSKQDAHHRCRRSESLSRAPGRAEWTHSMASARAGDPKGATGPRLEEGGL